MVEGRERSSGELCLTLGFEGGFGGRGSMWREGEPSLGRVRRLPLEFGPGDS
jgi:hypothetical protein